MATKCLASCLGQQMEMIAHEAVGHDLDAGELGHAPEHPPQRLLFDLIEEHIAAASARHDMVTIGLQRSAPEDAPPAARPGTRAGIEAGFGIHADELFFDREGLRISRLSRFHGRG